MSWKQQELVDEARAIRTRAADAKARMMTTRDAQERIELGRLLGALHRRHLEIEAMLRREVA